MSELYFPLLILLASRVPLDGDGRRSWLLWGIGLVLAALGIVVLFAAIHVASSFFGTGGRMEDIVNARNAMAGSSLTLIIVAALLAPSLLSLGFQATDGLWSRLAPSSALRHWLYFGVMLALYFALTRLWLPVRGN